MEIPNTYPFKTQLKLLPKYFFKYVTILLVVKLPLYYPHFRYPEFVLPDGSLRTTFARESVEQPTAVYPPCLSETSDVISRHFDSVFASVANLLENLTEKVLKIKYRYCKRIFYLNQ